MRAKNALISGEALRAVIGGGFLAAPDDAVPLAGDGDDRQAGDRRGLGLLARRALRPVGIGDDARHAGRLGNRYRAMRAAIAPTCTVVAPSKAMMTFSVMMRSPGAIR
jgi:hypothetical protein